MASERVTGKQLHLSVLSREGINDIHSASLEILERTGVFVELPRAREMLRGAGAIINGDNVRIPSFVVEKALQGAPKRVVISNRDGKRAAFLEGNRSYFTGIVDCPYVIDPITRSRRWFTSKDYHLTCKVIDACENIYGGGGGGSAHDYPPEVRAQVAFKYSMLNMTKFFMSCPLDAQQTADIYEMAAVMAGGWDNLRKAPFVIATAEPTTPLGICQDAAEILLLAARENMPVVWYPMPSAGTTAPATPAAALAVGNAEVLAGLVLHQLERPGAPFIYGAMPGMTDMRSTQWAYGSPNLAVQVAANTDLAHSYGLPMYGTAGCSDSFAVDEQSTAESTMLCLMALLSGANIVHDVGVLAGAVMISPELMALTDEILDMLGHATHPIDTSQDELALNLIDEVGPQGNYLALDHTLANFRRFWHSDVFLRNRLTGSPEDEPEPVADRLNKKTVEMLENHQVPPLSGDKLRELDELEQKWLSRISSAVS
ncbi:MAG: trimethylamine methyltransferase family protein [Chloroflexi bacterium]|nr:trimethylamine methyltransferase family protein [Chloroflexota bacterium]